MNLNMKAVAIGGTVTGLAVGSVAGYFLAKKQLELKFDEVLTREIEETKRHYSILNKTGEYASPEAVLQRRKPTKPEGVSDEEHEGPSTEVLETVLKKLKYGKMNEPKIATAVTHNVFERPVEDADVDYTEEDAARDTENGIYILDHDEFMHAEVGYEQVSYTFFEQDRVLSDENEEPIDDIEVTVGEANLDRFGHRSKDPNVVYIRNNKLRIDFEVCRSMGSYAEEVQGIVQEKVPRPRGARE